MLDLLDAATVRRWCSAALDALAAHQGEIDDLNVYPVPDGDTGTNLVLTLESGCQALGGGGPAGEGPEAENDENDLGAVIRSLAHGALLGARGNSGVILSQLLYGLADAMTGRRAATGGELARALAVAADRAYAAVAEPVEGTILTVARAAADAAGDAGDELPAVVSAAAEGARAALAHTPDQLPVLARAGVVDAGGRGLALVLDALAGVVTGRGGEPSPLPRVARDPQVLVAARETGSPEFGYEVQYLLDAEESAVGRLRDELGGLGDSLVVVGTGERLWNVHVHVNDVGAAVEAGLAAGRPHRITVTRFADRLPAPDKRTRATVALCPGPGLADLFAAEGAAVVATPPGAEPAVPVVAAAVRATGAADVVALPNGSEGIAAVAAAAELLREEGISVAVIPTRSPVQGLAALAVRDPARRFADEVIAMAEAAGATRWGEVTVAVRDAFTSAGVCHAGDVLGLLEGEVVLVGAGTEEVARLLLDRLLRAGGELVTLVLGAAADPALGGRVEEHLRTAWPMVEAAVYDGGQPDAPLLVGVE